MALNARIPIPDSAQPAVVKRLDQCAILACISDDTARKKQITDWYEAGDINAARAEFLVCAFGLESA